MIVAVKDKEKNTIAAKNTIKILDNSKCFFIFANEISVIFELQPHIN